MIKKTLLLVFIIFVTKSIVAQHVQLSGYVSDAQTGEKLMSATLYNTATKTGTLTNAFGFFSLSVAPSDSVQISYIGYEKMTLNTKKDTLVQVLLQPVLEISEVTVTTSPDILDNPTVSTIELKPSQIAALPTLVGESDLIKALQLMPGVQNGNEGSSSLFVRGGNVDQNLVLLDDVPLYYVGHLGGFLSVFNTDAISNVKLIKGGFPARYGGRLSSVLDIRMREGNMKKFSGTATVGMITSKISIEGPIIRDRTSFIASFRGFNYGLITGSLDEDAQLLALDGYSFNDMNLKINHIFSQHDRLFFSFYRGYDRNKIDETLFGTKNNNQKQENVLSWGNLLFALRWNHVFSPYLFGNTSASFIRYRYRGDYIFSDNAEPRTDMLRRYVSGISDATIKSDYDWFVSSLYQMRFGASLTHHNYIPSFQSYNHTQYTQGKDSIIISEKEYINEANAYIENEWKPLYWLNINAGIRANVFALKDTTFLSIEPRITSNIRLHHQWSLKASYSTMNQSLHLLSYMGTGLPADLWVPATRRAPAPKSEQTTLGVFYVHESRIEVSIEAFYKTTQRLIALQEGMGLLTPIPWQEKIEINGKGISKGIEFLVRKHEGKFTGWVSYTLSNSNQKFSILNNGKSFPAKYDRTHNIALVGVYQISKRWSLSGEWVFGSGQPFSLAAEYMYIQPKITTDNSNLQFYYPILVYNEINGYRMRSIHRLDISAVYTHTKKKGTNIWHFGIYNLYNRQNPYFYIIQTSIMNQKPQLLQYSLFPIMPSVSYSFKF